MSHGLLLINLGTPQHATPRDVRAFLKAFLSDKRVITLPWLLRQLLVRCIIVPFKTKGSTHAYQSIWQHEGSPLRYASEQLRDAVQQQLGSETVVVLGMRYGEPSLLSALESLKSCSHITILPLYPQYASSSTGSVLEEVLRYFSAQNVIPHLHILRDFYDCEHYINAYATLIQTHITPEDFLLFSYHGIPVTHLHQSGCQNVCVETCKTTMAQQGCYRAQCLTTSALLAKTLAWPSTRYTTAFQSRLGRQVWLQPYTDELLSQLAAQGVKRLAIACPSFTIDCLETLEEIAMRAKQQWLALGGESFTFIPSLNHHPQWVNAICLLHTQKVLQ